MRILSRFLPVQRRTAAGFLKQESGSVTIFAIVGFAMCLVLIGLVFDMGRVMGIHTEVSSYADRVALAAARELDGRPGALRDAIFAARTDTSVVGEGHRLSLNGDHEIGVRQLTFLAALDPDPVEPGMLSPMPDDLITATWRPGQNSPSLQNGFSLAEAEAHTRFVIVDTTREREEYMLFPVVAALTPTLGEDITISPQAVAGFDRRMCNITPVMVCNMNEQFQLNAEFAPQVGQQTRFRLHGRRDDGDFNDWSPRTYSLLDIASRSPASLQNYISRSDPNTQCYGASDNIESGLNSEDEPPDTKTAIGNGFNIRWNGGPSRRDFPAAVVNCVYNRALLNSGRPVPIEGYVMMRLLGPVNPDDANRDDEVFLENRGIVPTSMNRENRREYPVLVR